MRVARCFTDTLAQFARRVGDNEDSQAGLFVIWLGCFGV